MARRLSRIFTLLLVLAGTLGVVPRARAYSLNGYTWPLGSQVVMHLQLNRFQVPLQDGSGTWNGSATNALNLWNQHLDSMNFVAGPPVSSDPDNGTNDVFFDNSIYGDTFGANVLAVTVRWTSGQRFRETDVIFNNVRTWNSYRGVQQGTGATATYDLLRVALHEFGHALGLNHPDQAGQSVEAIMNSIIGDLDHLTGDDIAGAQVMYRVRITSPFTPPAVNSGNLFSYQIVTNVPSVSYTASGLPQGLTLDTTTGIITGRCPLSGVFYTTVTAQTASGASAQANIQITINPLPLTSGSPPDRPIGTPYSYQIAAGNSPTRFAASNLPQGLTVNASTGLISGTPTIAGTFATQIRASGPNSEAGGTYSIRITPPQITSSLSPTVLVGHPVSYRITATHNPTSFQAQGLPNWLQIDPATGVISGVAATSGNFYISVAANTAWGQALSTVILEVRPPYIVVPPYVSTEFGEFTFYQVAVSHDATGFEAVGLPSGLQIDPHTGVISGVATMSGLYQVTVTAHTAFGDATDVIFLSIRAPRLTSPDVTFRNIGDSFDFQVTASNHPTSFSATGLPAGLHLDPTTGRITGVAELSGIYSVQITAHGAVGPAVGTIRIIIEALDVITPPLAIIPMALRGPLVTDQSRDRIYAATAQGVVVIDTTGPPFSQIGMLPIAFQSSAELCISPDGSRLWAADGRAQIFAFNLDSLAWLQPLSIGHNIFQLRQGADGMLYTTTGSLPGVDQRDPGTGAVLAHFGPSAGNYASYLGMSADFRTLFVCDSLRFLGRYGLPSPVITPPALQQEINSVYGFSSGAIAVDPSGQSVLTFSLGRVVIRSATDLTVIRREILQPIDSYPSAVFSRDGALLFVTARYERDVQVYETTNFSLLRTIVLPSRARSGINGSLALSRDGRHLFVAGETQLFVYPVTPPSAPVPPRRLLNVSTRLITGTGDNVLIGGFIVTGSGTKEVVLRATGPSLPLNGRLADPKLELRRSDGSLLAENDNWNAHRAQIIGTGLPPNAEREAALVATLAPGSYTAIVSGVADTTGIGLVELYDLNPESTARLANISTRGRIETNDNVMIGGFIIGGGQPTRVIARAIGPSLIPYGITGALSDPTLDLHDGNGTLLASNDDWQSTQAAEIIASGVPPTNLRESAIVRTLPPGNFTAIVRGKDGTTGVGLVEVYNLESN